MTPFRCLRQSPLVRSFCAVAMVCSAVPPRAMGASTNNPEIDTPPNAAMAEPAVVSLQPFIPVATADILPTVQSESEDCPPQWSSEFCEPGIEYVPAAMLAIGSGPARGVHVAGPYEFGGQESYGIGRWDGTRWNFLSGNAAYASRIESLFWCDIGAGPQLVAGGNFTGVGLVAANRIAALAGNAWQPMGAGFADGSVRVMAMFDSGGGPQLHAAGTFLKSGSVDVNRIARWTGAIWEPLGSGLNGTVKALCVFDDGAGPSLFVGGAFSIAGGQAALNLAKWNGTTWSAVGGGTNGEVRSLAVHDDGGGPALYVGGAFLIAGSTPATGYLARWNGSTWASVGGGMSAPVTALLSADDGEGSALFAGGDFRKAGPIDAAFVARWKNKQWSALGVGTNSLVTHLAAFQDSGGPAIYVGGYFPQAGGLVLFHIARWGQGSWSALGKGIRAIQPSAALCLEPFGGKLHVGGYVRWLGGHTARGVARWSGSQWESLGSGYSGYAYDMQAANVEGAPMLYVAGRSYLNDVSLGSIVRWDGANWSSLDATTNEQKDELAEYDHGGGPQLIVGGYFDSIGGISANSIAAYANGTWSPLGAGVDGSVNDMIAHDDGSGPSLFVCGWFESAGGIPNTRGFARWDGQQWNAVGEPTGVESGVFALAEYDDGRGPALYVAGDFETMGGVPATDVARWDGEQWEAVGALHPDGFSVALGVYDDGDGPALYSSGIMYLLNGQISMIARWRDEQWSVPSGGIGHINYTSGADQPFAWALREFDDGTGPALWAAGQFTMAGGRSSFGIAKWQRTQYVPEIIQHPAGLIASVGQRVTLSVATAHAGGNVIQWMRDGAPLFDGGGVSGVNSLTLTLASVAPGDAGEYVASITNECGGAESDPALLIIHAPADMNGDAIVNKQDVDLFKGCFNLPGESITPDCYQADLNGDGLLTCADWPIFRAIWGSNQPVLLEGCTFTAAAGPIDE